MYKRQVFNDRRDIGAFEAQEECAVAAVAEVSSIKSMIFPNPSVNGMVTVQLSQNHSSEASIAIYELATGKLVQTTKAATGTTALQLQNVAAGTYIMKIVSDTATETHKVILGR